MPIFSACSSVAFHSILGLESLKLSWWQFQPGFCKVLAQLAVRQRLCIQAGVRAGLIQRHRVKGRKDADIRQDGSIVLAVAVAVGADVLHQNIEDAEPPTPTPLASSIHPSCGFPIGKKKGKKLEGPAPLPLPCSMRFVVFCLYWNAAAPTPLLAAAARPLPRRRAVSSCPRGSRSPCRCS